MPPSAGTWRHSSGVKRVLNPPVVTESEREKEMSDLKKYIAKRKKTDKEFAEGFEEGYEQFKIGVVRRQARESVGLTHEELAIRLKTQTRLLP